MKKNGNTMRKLAVNTGGRIAKSADSKKKVSSSKIGGGDLRCGERERNNRKRRKTT